MVGEIGGDEEEKAAEFIRDRMSKPVVAYIAGFTAPPGKTMGHAGAIISGSSGTAQAKKEALEACGVRVGTTPTEVAQLVAERRALEPNRSPSAGVARPERLLELARGIEPSELRDRLLDRLRRVGELRRDRWRDARTTSLTLDGRLVERLARLRSPRARAGRPRGRSSCCSISSPASVSGGPSWPRSASRSSVAATALRTASSSVLLVDRRQGRRGRLPRPRLRSRQSSTLVQKSSAHCSDDESSPPQPAASRASAPQRTASVRATQ